MKIKSIEIKNFRAIEDSIISCCNFNSIVGPNGAGKSTVLNALNLFFGEISNIAEDDFYNRDVSKPIRVKVTFHELTDAAQEEFKHYVRSGLLIVQAVVSKEANGAFKKTVHGERMIFEPFIPFFEGNSAGERGAIFKDLREKYPEIPNATNDADRRAALIEYEEKLDDTQKTLAASGEEFFGVSKGSHKFQKHLNWVYVPAVKDASTESEEAKNSHLGRLIQYTIRAGMNYQDDLEKIRQEALQAYQVLLDAQRVHLAGLQDRLAQRLQDCVTTDADLSLDWKKDEKSVAVLDPSAQVRLTDKGFSGEVEKFGHGLQRSFLIVILQELMSFDSEHNPILLLGIEEPELYQHPPQARHLASVLMELTTGHTQVFATTHSPYFIDVEHYGGIKMFRNEAGEVKVSDSSFDTIMTSYNEAFSKPLINANQARTKLAIQTQPKFNEIFFADKVVLVEGVSDQACLEAFLHLSERNGDFQKSGTAIIVCDGKSSLALMLLIAKNFDIPFHVIFDCDADCKDAHKDDHIKDNDAILALAGHVPLGELPTDHILKPNLSAWRDNIEQVLADEYAEDLQEISEAGSSAVGQLRSSKKNPIYIAATMKAAWDKGRRFPVLDQVITEILN